MSRKSVSLDAQIILNDILEQIDNALATDNEAHITSEIICNDISISKKEMDKTEYLEHTLEVIKEKLSGEIDLDER